MKDDIVQNATDTGAWSVKVADCIMGSGKSSSAINYMNEHADEKFIYITPYLEEAARIKEGCMRLRFVEPSNKIKQYKFKKRLHTAALIKEGRNITTTHQAFRGYTREMLDDIKARGYTLFIDENCEVLEKYDVGTQDDIQAVIDAGYLKCENGVYTVTDKEYNGVFFREFLQKTKDRELVGLWDDKKCVAFYWVLPPELILSFKNVFVMTYLFETQSLHHMFEIYGIPYNYIGIHRDESNGYHFGPAPGYTPEYVKELKQKIHILDNEKMNSVGDDHFAMSKGWFQKNSDGVSTLKRNVSNYYLNLFRGVPADKRLWGAYKDAFQIMKGKGYTKNFLAFNTKATNDYKSCNTLVYISNIFMNVTEAGFYKMNGIEVDQDRYALSIMVQWIWRSAIRDGEEIQIYIPSKRMRTILQNWINSFDNGGDANV